MHPAELDFIEAMGLRMEEDGLPRIAGRIYGLVLLREGPFSLDDLTEQLDVSKTSASTNARLLERMGILVRTSRPGDRRDFYRMAPDVPERSFVHVRRRMARTLEDLDRALERLGGESDRDLSRLAEIRDWHVFLLEELERVTARWRARRGDDAGKGRVSA